MYGSTPQQNPIRSCCNGTTALAGSIARFGARTTLAGKFQLLAYRELRVSATWPDCRRPETGFASKCRQVTSDSRASQSVAWPSVYTAKNQQLPGTARAKLQR